MLKSKLLVAIILAATVALAGCASGSKSENMIYQGAVKEYDDALKAAVDADGVTGGQQTNPLWTSEISNEAFAAALKETLKLQGLLSSGGRYKLQAKLINVDQPLFGLNFKVVTSTQYILTDTQTNSTIMKDIVVADHTAGIGDAFAAVKRLRLANEGSAKKNIEMLLIALSELDIKSVSVE